MHTVRDYGRMMHSVFECSTLFVEQCSPVAKTLVNAVFDHISSVLAPRAREKIELAAHTTMTQQLVIMNKLAADLKPRAHGGTSPNTAWWAGYFESRNPNLEWLLNTLNKIDTAGIEARITELEQASRRQGTRSADSPPPHPDCEPLGSRGVIFQLVTWGGL